MRRSSAGVFPVSICFSMISIMGLTCPCCDIVTHSSWPVVLFWFFVSHSKKWVCLLCLPLVCFFFLPPLRYDMTTTLHMLDTGRWDGERVDSLHTRHLPQIGANAEKNKQTWKTVSQDYFLQSACLHVAQKLMEISEPWIWSKLSYYFTTTLQKKEYIYNEVFRIRHQLWF